MKFGQLILRKIIKIVTTRCQILRLNCTKFDFGWGSATDPAGEAFSAPLDPLAGFKGPTSKGREGKGRKGRERGGRGGDRGRDKEGMGGEGKGMKGRKGKEEERGGSWTRCQRQRVSVTKQCNWVLAKGQ